ncbi:general substrate transporter [Lophiostoma macrostomum CBS 122681]|uniref:General substrate transporter n=1 Tax=Lophiostoma macrostomum CBS 122681 TaxID=1314788 RepID=A0A6A6TNY1_9PLEO|nr:general substrate transporter [Lophiostoma macrostomum CBS 122681]
MGGPGGVVAYGGDAAYKTLKNNVHPQWIHDPGLRKLNFGIGLMFASAAANGYDGSLMNGLLAIPRFTNDLGDISTSVLGLLIAGISLGGIPAFIPASYVSDSFGRRLTVAIGSSIMVAASAIQAGTSGPWAFLGTRIMLGLGLGFSQTAAPPLTTEIAHPKQRGQVTALFQATYYWGAITSACITLGTLFLSDSWSWRTPCLIQALFPALQLLGLRSVPESPRWLVSKGRTAEALAMLAKYHANGDSDDELVRYEFYEICEALEKERRDETDVGFVAFARSKGNRHRLLICVLVGFMIQWAGNGIVSYYLAPILKSVGITSSVSQAGINLGLQVWNAILAGAGAVAVERYGRRPLWLISALGMLASFTIITALSAVFANPGIKAAGSAVVAFLFVFFGFYDIAFTPLSVAYPVEILPYSLRTKGFSITLTVIFVAGFFNQYVNPIALGAIQWKFYFVYIGTLIAMILIIYFLFPETKGRTLEEIALVFDGEQATTEVQRRLSVATEEGRTFSQVMHANANASGTFDGGRGPKAIISHT